MHKRHWILDSRTHITPEILPLQVVDFSFVLALSTTSALNNVDWLTAPSLILALQNCVSMEDLQLFLRFERLGPIEKWNPYGRRHPKLWLSLFDENVHPIPEHCATHFIRLLTRSTWFHWWDHVKESIGIRTEHRKPPNFGIFRAWWAWELPLTYVNRVASDFNHAMWHRKSYIVFCWYFVFWSRTDVHYPKLLTGLTGLPSARLIGIRNTSLKEN